MLRARLGMTLAAVAEVTGYSIGALCRYEKGHRTPSEERIKHIEDVLKAPKDCLTKDPRLTWR
jgi:transcriptional regulator with XRE-family HTH domain